VTVIGPPPLPSRAPKTAAPASLPAPPVAPPAVPLAPGFRAERDDKTCVDPLPPAGMMTAPSSTGMRVWVERGSWLVAGCLATVAVMVLRSSSAPSPVAVVSPAASAPRVMTPVAKPLRVTPGAPARTTVARTAAAPAGAAPAAAPVAGAAPVAAPATGGAPVAAAPAGAAPAEGEAAEPALFDPTAAGLDGAARARQCFPGVTHTVAFGAGLLYSRDATARRIFLSPDDPLTPDERRCLMKSMIGANAGAPPETKGIVVELRLRLRPDGQNEVRVISAK
jgi:hypothetical protein